MKKTMMIAAIAFGFSNAFAQDAALTSKKGEPILPEAGDWGLAIDATPFLNYAGNFFGKTTNNNAPTWNFFTNNQTITGKYFVDATTAYRATVRLGMSSNTSRNMVVDRAAAQSTNVSFPSPDVMVENSWKRSQNNFGISGGIEKRRGKTRLQGFYGGELGIWISNSKDKFSYGNAINTGTATPVGVHNDDAFAGASNIGTPDIQGMSGNARVIERKNGSVFSFGIRGFIGAEYFILPKMSLGGEFGWGIGMTSMGASSTTWESQGASTGATSNSIGKTDIEGAKQGSFALDTDGRNSIWGPTGSLRLALHF